MTDITKDLRDALAAHAKWKTNLRNAVDQGTSEFSVATVARDDHCAFGKWLYGPAAAELSGSARYTACKQAHAQFHTCAAEVLGLAVAGQRDEAEAKLSVTGEFSRRSAAVSSEILAWLKEQNSAAAAGSPETAVAATGRFAKMRFSITTKLVAMVGVSLSVLVLVGVLGILGLQSASSSAQHMYTRTVQPLGEVGVAGITTTRTAPSCAT